jgi:hypothetical protein
MDGKVTKRWIDLPFVKNSRVFDATDIANQYYDLPDKVRPNSLDFIIGGVTQNEGEDYTLSTVGLITRVTFTGELATGGASAIINGDKGYFKYCL